MRLSDLEPRFQGHDIIQRQKNSKMVQDGAIFRSYTGRPIKIRIWSIERRHFQWPWTIPNLVFKVTPFFDTEYLTNGCIDTAIVTIEGE